MNTGDIVLLIASGAVIVVLIMGVISTTISAKYEAYMIGAIKELSKHPDLEIVTRCKDCEYFEENSKNSYCICGVDPLDYCSRGKPKEKK